MRKFKKKLWNAFSVSLEIALSSRSKFIKPKLEALEEYVLI